LTGPRTPTQALRLLVLITNDGFSKTKAVKAWRTNIIVATLCSITMNLKYAPLKKSAVIKLSSQPKMLGFNTLGTASSTVFVHRDTLFYLFVFIRRNQTYKT